MWATPTLFIRSRLHKQLDAAFASCRAVWISGIAGAGKTTLANAYLGERRARVIAHRVDEGDRDPALLFARLGALTDQSLGSTPAYPGRDFKGEVTAIDTRIDPATRAARLNASFDNADGSLKPGMFLTVSLAIATRDNAVVVPEDALVAPWARPERPRGVQQAPDLQARAPAPHDQARVTARGAAQQARVAAHPPHGQARAAADGAAEQARAGQARAARAVGPWDVGPEGRAGRSKAPRRAREQAGREGQGALREPQAWERACGVGAAVAQGLGEGFVLERCAAAGLP